jgi:release factor glutamine methyltransferase
LRRAGVESFALDAELLLAAAAGIDRVKLLTGSFALEREHLERFCQLVARRASREPLAYIAGRKEFHGLEIEVDRNVLIPRPETELVVDVALRFLRHRPPSLVMDLGTGSGAIAIAVGLRSPGARISASDISAAALEVASRNAERHGCVDRIEFLPGDGFAAIPCSHPKFDLIVSNPPYVRDDEVAGLQPEVARYEPGIALRGGKDGLDFYRRIADGAGSYLAAGGEIIVELGAGQAVAAARILEQGGWRTRETIRDLAGHERVLRARLGD